MNEQAITFENRGEIISGVLHIPDTAQDLSSSMVVFLHGFAGYRIGPHQLFVKLARKLAHEGHTCIRFDFRGRGYSQSKKEATSYKTMVSDLDAVLKDIHRQFSPTRLILLGICSGTRTALYYIKNKECRVDGLIGLSSPPLTNTSDISATTKRTKSVFEDYLQKARVAENWRRLLKGETNTPMISKIVRGNLKNIWCAFCSKLLRQPFKAKIKGNSNKNAPFSNFTGGVLLIHGEKDPDTLIALNQISKMLLTHNITYQERIIKGANHSFYSIKWENEIVELVKNWLATELN